MLNRARVLLKADQGELAGEEEPTPGDREIAGMLETFSATVGRVRERFIRRGLDAALERSMPDRAYERPLDGSRGVPDALPCSKAPTAGTAGACGCRRTKRWNSAS